MLGGVDGLPPVLYVEVSITPDDHRSVTIVGARRPTARGNEVTRQLARVHVTVISGLAHGVDGIAYRTALEAGGRTRRSWGQVATLFTRSSTRL